LIKNITNDFYYLTKNFLPVSKKQKNKKKNMKQQNYF